MYQVFRRINNRRIELSAAKLKHGIKLLPSHVFFFLFFLILNKAKTKANKIKQNKGAKYGFDQ